MNKKEKERNNKIFRLVVLIVILSLTINLIFFSLVVRSDYKLKNCNEEIKMFKEVTFKMCNNFNGMAESTKFLINKYINESFDYVELPNCTSLK